MPYARSCNRHHAMRRCSILYSYRTIQALVQVDYVFTVFVINKVENSVLFVFEALFHVLKFGKRSCK